MCGIVGAFSTTLSLQEREIFRELLTVSVVRGDHSTGVVASWRNHKTRRNTLVHQKDATDPYNFLWSEDQKAAGESPLKPDNDHILTTLIGHNRLATQGAVNRQNAHPFSFRNVIGVHNGTISNVMPNRAQYGTDSETLYSLINDRGIDEAVKYLGFGTSSCAYALAYINRQDSTINLISNGQRPLTYYPTHGSVFFASESMMLHWILSRNRIAPDVNKYVSLHETPFKLHVFELGSSKLVEVRDLTPKSRTNYGYGSAWGMRSWEEDVVEHTDKGGSPAEGRGHFHNTGKWRWDQESGWEPKDGVPGPKQPADKKAEEKTSSAKTAGGESSKKTDEQKEAAVEKNGRFWNPTRFVPGTQKFPPSLRRGEARRWLKDRRGWLITTFSDSYEEYWHGKPPKDNVVPLLPKPDAPKSGASKPGEPLNDPIPWDTKRKDGEEKPKQPDLVDLANRDADCDDCKVDLTKPKPRRTSRKTTKVEERLQQRTLLEETEAEINKALAAAKKQLGEEDDVLFCCPRTNALYTYDELDKILQQGCSYCGEVFSVAEVVNSADFTIQGVIENLGGIKSYTCDKVCSYVQDQMSKNAKSLQ